MMAIQFENWRPVINCITAIFFILEQDFDLAIQHYSEAIELNPYVHIYYGNRSFAYLKTECFGFALDDASKSIQLNRSYVKVGI